MSSSLDLRHLVAVFQIAVLSAAATGAAGDAGSCFVERGRIIATNITSVAASGRLVAALQRGSWDTRPMARIVEVSPAELDELGRWQAAWYVSDIALDADTSFVAADSGLVPLDLSEPRNPVELDFIDLLGADHLAVVDGLAFVATDGAGGYGRFDVVDVSNPADLQQRGGLTWGRPDPHGMKTAVDASGGLAAFTCHEGLVVIDVGDPWHPTERGSWIRDGSRDVALVDGSAAVAISSWVDPADVGVEIIDLSDPDNPTFAGFWPAPSAVVSVAEYGGAVLAGTESDGIFLVDFDDPANPVVLDNWQTPGMSVDHLATAWPTVVLSDLLQGAVVLGLSPPCLAPRRSSGRVGR